MSKKVNLERCFRYMLAASTVFPVAARAQARPPAASAMLHSGTLSFTGHATVGDFVGSTTTMSGVVAGDVPDVHGWVEAPVATLVTHNERRDRDMRSSLEVDKYATMRFDLAGATVVSSFRGDSLAVLLHGKLAIHGVARAVDLPATVSRSADTIHVTAAFPLDLADYRIGGLTKMFGLLRMQRLIEVRLDILFVGPSRDERSGQ